MCASISLVLSFGLLGLESFVVPFFPGLGYVANRIPRSCSRSLGFSPSFRLEGLSRNFYGLCFVGLWNRSGVFDPSPSPSGLRYLVFVSLVSSTAWYFVGFRSGIRSVLRSLWCFLEGASRWCSYGIVLRRLSGSASVVPLPFPVPFLGRSVCSQNLRRRTFRRSDRGVPDRGFSFSCVSSSEARTFETQ